MGIFSFLTEKKKEQILPAVDVKNLGINDGDAVTAYGNVNNEQFLQYDRGITESQRIETYRQIAKAAEIDEVITDIVNESFIFQRDKKAFELDWFPNVEISDQLKDKIYEEFKNIYDISNFDDLGSDYFQSFYIDGRIVFQKVYDKTNAKSSNGIEQIIRVDPMNLVKVRIIPQRDRKDNMINISDIKEFFVYSNKKIANQKNYLNNIYYQEDEIVDGIRLTSDDITYITSGLIDSIYDITIGHLDKAIIPYNNLKMMEQSMVIFRVARAPMRRAFYVDVSSMSKPRGDEYMKSMYAKFKSKLVYNTDTGSWVDEKSVISMLEDYFIPRFNESKTTEIQNIEGQSSQEILDEVNYMKDKLYQSLNAPKSRFAEEGNVFLFGKTDQIPRDEYRFKKFIDRIRNRFMLVFDDLLKSQLIMKKIINEDEWDEIKRSYFWRFTEDNAFIEYKDSEIFNNRLDTVGKMSELISSGYYSKLWVRKNVLMQTDEEIEEIDMQVFKEKTREAELESDPSSDSTPAEDDTMTPPGSEEPTDDTTIQEPDSVDEPDEA